jgi:hypothetical protein
MSSTPAHALPQTVRIALIPTAFAASLPILVVGCSDDELPAGPGGGRVDVSDEGRGDAGADADADSTADDTSPLPDTDPGEDITADTADDTADGSGTLDTGADSGLDDASDGSGAQDTGADSTADDTSDDSGAQDTGADSTADDTSGDTDTSDTTDTGADSNPGDTAPDADTSDGGTLAAREAAVDDLKGAFRRLCDAYLACESGSYDWCTPRVDARVDPYFVDDLSADIDCITATRDLVDCLIDTGFCDSYDGYYSYYEYFSVSRLRCPDPLAAGGEACAGTSAGAEFFP